MYSLQSGRCSLGSTYHTTALLNDEGTQQQHPRMAQESNENQQNMDSSHSSSFRHLACLPRRGRSTNAVIVGSAMVYARISAAKAMPALHRSLHTLTSCDRVNTSNRSVSMGFRCHQQTSFLCSISAYVLYLASVPHILHESMLRKHHHEIATSTTFHLTI